VRKTYKSRLLRAMAICLVGGATVSCSIDCKKFGKLRDLYGVDWDCDNCESFFDGIDSFLQNPPKDVGVRNELLSSLKVEFNVGKPSEKRFACNVLRTTINTPCGLTNCPWWVHNKTHLNCLKCFVVSHDGDNISPEEFSWLYRVPYDRVSRVYNHWLIDLQRSRLRQRLEDYPRWNYIPTQSVCCVCESLITDKPQHTDGKHAWCSPTCLFEKEPWVVKTEHMYGASMESILLCASKSFRNYSLAQRTLGLTKFQMRIACNRYVGVHVRELFKLRKTPPLCDGSRKEDAQPQNFQELVVSLRKYRKRHGIELPAKLRKLSKKIATL